MRRAIALVVGFLIGVGPMNAWAAQRGVPQDVEINAFKQMAAAIPLGSRVKVQTVAGRRLTATLMSVTGDAIVVQRASRLPEPAVAIPFDEIRRLERDEGGKGLSLVKAIGVGLAAGAGAMLTLFAIVLTIDD